MSFDSLKSPPHMASSVKGRPGHPLQGQTGGQGPAPSSEQTSVFFLLPPKSQLAPNATSPVHTSNSASKAEIQLKPCMPPTRKLTQPAKPYFPVPLQPCPAQPSQQGKLTCPYLPPQSQAFIKHLLYAKFSNGKIYSLSGSPGLPSKEQARWGTKALCCLTSQGTPGAGGCPPLSSR